MQKELPAWKALRHGVASSSGAMANPNHEFRREVVGSHHVLFGIGRGGSCAQWLPHTNLCCTVSMVRSHEPMGTVFNVTNAKLFNI